VSCAKPQSRVRSNPASPSMIKPIRCSPARTLLRRHAVKHFSQKVTQKADRVHLEDVPSDPRPPWVYRTSTGLRLILIPSEFKLLAVAEYRLNTQQVFCSMPYSLLTLETEIMSLCPYVIIVHSRRKSSLTINPQATKMGSRTLGGISHHYTRGTEACRGVYEQPGSRQNFERRRCNPFRTVT